MKLHTALLTAALFSAANANAAEPVEECSEGTAYTVSGTATIGVTSASTVITDTNVTDVASGKKARFRLAATQDMYVDLNRSKVTSPTATVTDTLLFAGVPEYFCLPSGTNIGAAATSTGGNLNVSRMVR